MLGLLEQALKIAESGLTVRKAFSGVFIILIFVGGLFAYEAYTGTWQLARLEKATAILERLQSIENAGALSDQLRESYDKASEQLHGFLVEAESIAPPQSIKVEQSASPTLLAKFLSGGAIWFLSSLPFLIFIFKRQSGGWPGLFGMLVVGVFFGAVNMVIPNIYEPWVNLVLIPFVTFFVLIGIPVAIPAFAKVRETSQRKMIMNNLRQLASAAHQYFLEEGETLVLVQNLIGEDAYIRSLEPIYGELYPDKISTDMKELSAVLPNGDKVSMSF